MITDIQVKVEGKVASVIGSPVIICGNSDYTVTFTFDEEWETLELKTARFVYKRDGAYQYIDVPFSGRVVQVPILSNIEEVILGVYTGELHTTTPTRILCKKSILCDTGSQHEEPDEDLYQQLLDTINNLELLPTVSKADAGKALMVREDGHWVVRCPDFMHNQKDGALIRFFFGTSKEWEDWTGDKNNVLFIPTDDTTFEDILAAAEEKAVEVAQEAVKELEKSVDERLTKLGFKSGTVSGSGANGYIINSSGNSVLTRQGNYVIGSISIAVNSTSGVIIGTVPDYMKPAKDIRVYYGLRSGYGDENVAWLDIYTSGQVRIEWHYAGGYSYPVFDNIGYEAKPL